MEKAAEDSCFPFSRLPDDIVLQVYNKIMDLKTLCRCQLISKRLGLIVFEVDTISFHVPLLIDYENENRVQYLRFLFESFTSFRSHCSSGALDSDPALLRPDSFPSAIKFIKRFTKLKSICIQFPSYVNAVVVDNDVDYPYFFKWKIKFGTSLAIPKDVLEEDEEAGSDEEQEDTYEDRVKEIEKVRVKTSSCMMDVVHRLEKVLDCTVEFPLLENISIMDSNERGIVTLIGGQGDELRNFLHTYRSKRFLVRHGVEYAFGSISYSHS